MKYVVFLLIFLFLPPVLFAQDGQRQNIELPNFVITGVEKIELPTAEKIAPPSFGISSESFLKPGYTSDLLKAAVIDPVQSDISLNDSMPVTLNKLTVYLGNYQLPNVSYSLMYPYRGFSITGELRYLNQRAFVENSDYSLIAPKIGASYKIINEASLFDGNEISANFSFMHSRYNFYAAKTVSDRKLNDWNFDLALRTSGKNFWQYQVSLLSERISLNAEGAGETISQFDARTGFSSAHIDFSPSLQYRIMLTDGLRSSSSTRNYLQLRAPLQFIATDILDMSAGIHFTTYDSIRVLDPSVSLTCKLLKGLTIAASYGKEHSVWDYKAVIEKNRYADASMYFPIIFSKDDLVTLNVEYQYDLILDVTVGGSIWSSAHQPYFRYTEDTASFLLETSDADGIAAFIETKLFPFQDNWFYGKIQFNSLKNAKGQILPYSPTMQANTVYGYRFSDVLVGRLGLTYENSAYADIGNAERLAETMSMFAEAGFYLFENMLISGKVENLLNRKNYYFKNYQQTPFEIVGGISYKW